MCQKYKLDTLSQSYIRYRIDCDRTCEFPNAGKLVLMKTKNDKWMIELIQITNQGKGYGKKFIDFVLDCHNINPIDFG